MIQVTNWKYADIGTGVAAANQAVQGMVCKVTDSSGKRLLTVLTDTDDALVFSATYVNSGNYAVAMKVDTDANEVDFANPDGLAASVGTANRFVTIRAADLIMEVRRGSKIEYSADLVDASLDPARSGATPAVGDSLGVKGGKWATVAAATATGIMPVPAIARVHKVFGTNFVVELV